MCGIAGFHNVSTGPSARLLLERMIRALRHRGPEETGYHIDDRVGLAHARLSIIDLAGGQQPLSSEDGAVWVSFNGEVFNYVELRDELMARGHAFRTHSDTETLVHAYEDDGPAFVERLNGDFAFALWDRRRNRLMLARDRMGVRPLYYALKDGALVFASEIKAILQFPGIHPELDPIAIDQCFTFWFPLAPRTAFKGVFELPPGHMLLAEGDRVTVKPYWQMQFPTAEEDRCLARQDEDAIADELRSLLIDATRIRLRADVPVGAYLSGGLDSSIVTTLIRLFNSNRLRTFSVGFESSEFDESRYQQELVRALGTEHESITCTTRDIGRLFPDVIYHTECPILRTAPSPLLALARLVRHHGFKVVLTGEGADEIFAGYDIFKEARIRRFWARQPGSSRRPRLLRRLYPYLANLQGQPQAYLEAFFRIGLADPGDPVFSHLPRWTMTSRLKAFFSADLRAAVAGYNALDEMRSRLPAAFSSWHPLSQAQYLEAAYLLPAYILSSQGDRVAMAEAVEARFPFLDHRVVGFAASIPARMKLKGLTEKHILRKSLARRLPASILNRPKQPYRAPDSQSFFGPGADYAEELLCSRAIAEAGYFDPRPVEKLVEKCRGGGSLGFRDNMALVGILSVQLLHRLFVRSPAIAQAAAPAMSL